MRSILLLLICTLSTAWAAEPKAKACPATRAEVKAGAACTPTKSDSCDYPEGKWCACEASRCVSPAGPIPNCKSKLRWVCRDDGCPRAGGSSCATEGKRCNYDDGMCSSSLVCREGEWVGLGQPRCRPAAPPRP